MFNLASIVNINPAEYSAQYSAVPLSGEPSNCHLPDQLAITPLTPIALPNIPLDCKPLITPPIVAPYSCIASLTGNILFKGADTITVNGVTGGLGTNVSIVADPTSECGYSLNGSITIGGGGGGGGGGTMSGDPTPVFACSGETPLSQSGTTYTHAVITDITLSSIKLAELFFDTGSGGTGGCCGNTYAKWDTCGQYLVVSNLDFTQYLLLDSSGGTAALTITDTSAGINTSIDCNATTGVMSITDDNNSAKLSPEQLAITNTAATNSITLGVTDSSITIVQDSDNSVLDYNSLTITNATNSSSVTIDATTLADAGDKTATFRELTFCVNGESKRAMVLMTDFYT